MYTLNLFKHEISEKVTRHTSHCNADVGALQCSLFSDNSERFYHRTQCRRAPRARRYPDPPAKLFLKPSSQGKVGLIPSETLEVKKGSCCPPCYKKLKHICFYISYMLFYIFFIRIIMFFSISFIYVSIFHDNIVRI